MITPEEAIEEVPAQTIANLEPGIDQQLNDQFVKYGDIVKVDLVGQPKKILDALTSAYQAAGWTVTGEGSTLLFTAQDKGGAP